MMPIVTSTYRYKPPRRKRKPVAIQGPRIVTPADPKKSRRRVGNGAAVEDGSFSARAGEASDDVQPQHSTPPERRRDPAVTTAGKAPPPANDTGPRKDVSGGSIARPPKSAIVTVRERKTVQRQREQQQMAALASDEPKRSAIVTARKPAKAIPDGWLPDTPEEHKRRGDAADALFQEMKRRISGKGEG